jgi:hypothetical protein
MRLDRRGSWIDTKRELALIAWAVFLIDLVAIGVATLANKAMDGGVFFWGPVLAIYVTTVFAIIVAVNLAIEYAIHLWHSREARLSARRRSV